MCLPDFPLNLVQGVFVSYYSTEILKKSLNTCVISQCNTE